jgi:hypothetical protein
LYRCRHCRRAFSARRFCVEFRLHKPHLTPWALSQLVSCVSLRQAARQREGVLSRGALSRRLWRYGRHSHRLLRLAVRRGGTLAGEFQLDEAESFEGGRREAPLTIPVLIHSESRFLVAAAVGTLPPRRAARKRAGATPRRHRSRRVVSRCLSRLALLSRRAPVFLDTDRKPLYGSLLRERAELRRVGHTTYSSRLPRGAGSPLFPINHTLAMVRDGLSRMRRRTWCTTKRRAWLWAHLGLWAAWRNFTRRRFNFDRETPAQLVGLASRRWRLAELVRWRLDLGAISLRSFVHEFGASTGQPSTRKRDSA